MKKVEIYNLLAAAHRGEQDARERLIEEYRSFIAREAGRVCRRPLEWGRDDELSIALIAFNEAIDAYNHERKHGIESLARMVIRRRLIDYFRSTKNHRENLVSTVAMRTISMEEDWEQGEREEEIKRYRQLLQTYRLDFNLVASSLPKHRQTRIKLRSVARILASRPDLMKILHSTRKLPRQELSQLSGATPRVLERGRVYIIALALLLSGDEFPHLREYVWDSTVRTGKEGENR